MAFTIGFFIVFSYPTHQSRSLLCHFLPPAALTCLTSNAEFSKEKHLDAMSGLYFYYQETRP